MSIETTKKVEFANLNFKGLQKQNILEEEEYLKFIVTVNSEFIVKANNNDAFRNIINKNIATFDGQLPFFLAKKQFPNTIIEKISGSDLIYDFCEMAKEKNKKIYLLGGNQESNDKATINIKKKYGVEVRGFSPDYRDYPFDRKHNKLILDKLNDFEPDILFVGFGAVKQEFWIDQFYEELKDIGVKWVVGCGSTFRFVAGTIKRAPKWVQNIGFEGVYRFLQEPNSMRFKRLILSTKIFKYL